MMKKDTRENSYGLQKLPKVSEIVSFKLINEVCFSVSHLLTIIIVQASCQNEGGCAIVLVYSCL